MPRGLTTAVKNELATGVIEPVILLELGFATPVYLLAKESSKASEILKPNKNIK